jgi:hypothetical protein
MSNIRRLKRPDSKSINASFDLANTLQEDHKGYVTHFHHNNRLYVVIFDENMSIDAR